MGFNVYLIMLIYPSTQQITNMTLENIYLLLYTFMYVNSNNVDESLQLRQSVSLGNEALEHGPLGPRQLLSSTYKH
jgi:hypothetical protein